MSHGLRDPASYENTLHLETVLDTFMFTIALMIQWSLIIYGWTFCRCVVSQAHTTVAALTRVLGFERTGCGGDVETAEDVRAIAARSSSTSGNQENTSHNDQ